MISHKKLYELNSRIEYMNALNYSVSGKSQFVYINDVKNKKEVAFDPEKNMISKYAHSLVESGDLAFFLLNFEGKIIELNSTSIRILEVSKENVIGTFFFDYFLSRDKNFEVYQLAFANGIMTDFSLSVNNLQQTELKINGSVYKDEKGNVLGMVIVARDITAQKKYEEELIEAKNRAEIAKQKAEKELKSKQQFFSYINHEIRTPMNAIIGFTKILLKTDLNESQKKYTNAIELSGDALIILINDLLDLAKVEAGKMTFEKISFKLADVIANTALIFESKILEKKLELALEYDEGIPSILIGDPMRLQQIILNLLSNSLKFTNEGSITIKVSLLNEDDQNVSLEFSLTDTGMGIPENKTEKIFENFQQAASSTSRLFGGTGLGLAIVKEMVEAQNGTLSLKSQVGKGSTFSFILSFKKEGEKFKLENENSIELIPKIKGVKVLVAEDILMNQLLIKTLLEKFDFELNFVKNGKTAIEQLQKKNYDIILMDLHMPEMNGFEATQHIRNKMNSMIPIIALTADITKEDIEKCINAGMNDYIPKPVEENVLYEKIIKYVKQSDNWKTVKVSRDNGLPKLMSCQL